MQLKQIDVRNFRLLNNVCLLLEKTVTVIVGRNNTGKTSLTEVMKRVLLENGATFRLEDFSFPTHQQFWDAFLSCTKNAAEEEIRKGLPSIDVRLTFSYEKTEELGVLNEFIVDLDPNCTEAVVAMRYSLKDGKLKEFFADLTETD